MLNLSQQEQQSQREKPQTCKVPAHRALMFPRNRLFFLSCIGITSPLSIMNYCIDEIDIDQTLGMEQGFQSPTPFLTNLPLIKYAVNAFRWLIGAMS